MPTAIRRAKIRKAIRDAALKAALETAVTKAQRHVSHPLVISSTVGLVVGAVAYSLIVRAQQED